MWFFLALFSDNCDNFNFDISIGGFIFENDNRDNHDIWGYDYWLL